MAAGSLVGGLIFNKYSGNTAFRVFGVGCSIFCGIHALIMCILNKKSNYGFPPGNKLILHSCLSGLPYWYFAGTLFDLVDRTEPEGQEMFKISSSTQDVADSDEGT